jgi:nicotinate-nucleotide pyrophosphorylase (carboxylating)
MAGAVMPLDRSTLADVVHRALAEDVGAGDVTCEAVVPEGLRSEATFISREPGVLAGLPAAEEVFRQISDAVAFAPYAKDGDAIEAGSPLAAVTGPARSLFTGERVALNFLQRLSGIATLTHRCVKAVAGYDCRILDTRKTTPGLRLLEKYAVAAGGGHNHRLGLYDQVLIKDNHLAALLPEAGDIVAAVALALRKARRRVGAHMCVEIEVETLAMVEAAREAGADILLLDNMSEADMRAATEAIRVVRAERGGSTPIGEASGGLTLDRLAAVAATGVDAISLGMLTHSAPALDIALDM